MSLASFMMRRGCKKSDAKRDAGLTTPVGIVRYEDISYGPHKMNVLDVYRPKDKEGQILPPDIFSVYFLFCVPTQSMRRSLIFRHHRGLCQKQWR